MLSQVDRANRRQEWVVFLGWEPHPMNRNFDLAYLEDGDEFFGPDLGGATSDSFQLSTKRKTTPTKPWIIACTTWHTCTVTASCTRCTWRWMVAVTS
jgi:ABC-type proline/glycine betaine transport system substrate-binding protein